MNVDSAYPIVKDEYADEITLKLAIRMQDDAGEPEDLYVFKHLKEKYNINFEVEYITAANMSERKNLMFASGEMPDILMNSYVSATEIVKYGVGEGLFLQMDDYLNETLTPNILKYFEGEAKSVCTASDGHVYTLPYLTDSNDVNYFDSARLFINSAWLKELGLELPRTLDEFVDAMYAIKEADPAGVGSENLYPMGGGMDNDQCSWYLLNALGYITYDSYGLTPALRDGKVVIPAYDMDIFKEYLTLMNQFYKDGIIPPTYFTIDSTEVNSYVASGRTAMYDNAPYLTGAENVAEFESCYPLTSDWQLEPEIGSPFSATIGGFVISADTKYPEVCMRLADAFFNNDTDFCAALSDGYVAGSEEAEKYSFGYVMRKYDPETGLVAIDVTETPGNINAWPYQVQYLKGNIWRIGASLLPESTEAMIRAAGYPDYVYKVDYTGADAWKASMAENIQPYGVDSFPNVLYSSEEINQQISDLETVIEPYAKEQIALFITGKRDLSEVDAFKEELKKLGMEDYLNIYTDLYNQYIQ